MRSMHHVAAAMMTTARHHDDARRTVGMRAAHRMTAMHAAVAHAVTMHALRGCRNGSENRGSGSKNQSNFLHVTSKEN
jgi:hypothetical protein